MAKDRLYYHDSKLCEFEADVISCEGPFEKEDGAGFWKVKLSPNAFYPESGGQPSDRGKVDDVDVIDVIEDEQGEVVVILGQEVAGKVSCLIDSARRFDLMQQHTGQHILSAAMERLFWYETIGFHLSEEYCTVDLDVDRLDESQADQAEDLANSIVFLDVPVRAEFVDDAKLASYELRKVPKVDSDIRIVSVEGFDNCPCGGTHVSRTGEIGLVKITRIDRAKGKVRIEVLCGGRALADYRRKNKQLASAATSLSIHPMELESQVGRILSQLKESKKSLQEASTRLMEYDSARIWDEAERVSGVKVIVYDAGQGGMDFAKQFALKLVSNPSTAAAIGASGPDTAYLVVARSQDLGLDASAVFKAAITSLEGKGGGNKAMAQGGGAKLGGLAAALEEAKMALLEQIG
ncbi:MAG TPA: DHHA1 domain-containing protein [Bacillota bacterium]|nr:DHHA1 domain-containing protein [Bacillota bacterium]HQJ23801.1 DHHA1 domain-containing protein [Bacillota bacterium]